MLARGLFVKNKKLRVFDFDDVLVRTKSNIYVTNENGNTRKLTPGQYAMYKRKPGDTFDFSEFENVNDPEEIHTMTRVLRSMIKAEGNRDLYILTARGVKRPVENYLRDIGIRGIEVVALGDGNPESKAQWIESKVTDGKYDDVFFVDDSERNIKAVKRRLSRMGISHRVKLMKSEWK